MENMGRWLSVALFALCGCSSPTSSDDVGSQTQDAAVDMTISDQGQPDSVLPDLGHPMADAGVNDTGSTPADLGIDASPDMTPDFGPLDDRPSSSRHVKVPLGTADAANGYWEYLPPQYQRGQAIPLLVFWHGIGENGDGSDAALDQVTNGGPPRYISRDEWPNDRPFVVLSPQHAGGGCPAPDEIRDFIAFAMTHYDVDPARIYLTGLSCGAIGSWNYLGQHIETSPVAAAVLIAGNGSGAVNNAGCALAELPIWGFHGDADPTVPVSGTRDAMETLMACPDPKAELKLTIYEGVGHNSWSRTYDLSAGHEIYDWMLSKERAP